MEQVSKRRITCHLGGDSRLKQWDYKKRKIPNVQGSDPKKREYSEQESDLVSYQVWRLLGNSEEEEIKQNLSYYLFLSHTLFVINLSWEIIVSSSTVGLKTHSNTFNCCGFWSIPITYLKFSDFGPYNNNMKQYIVFFFFFFLA